MRGRKQEIYSLSVSNSWIEKEKSPWGDENDTVQPVNLFKCSYRKREIPVRGRKLFGFCFFRFYDFIEKEKSPWGDENSDSESPAFLRCIEKEKSPWGDENNARFVASLITVYNRKREIPVRGRKPGWLPTLHLWSTEIEKEKSPWGDENLFHFCSLRFVSL